MRRFPVVIFTLMLVLVTVVSCSKTPPGIISERKMKNLLKDIYRAEAYIEGHSSEFATDSQKMVLKQSIFEKHGVSQALYDSSLVWYAKNIDVLNNVYRKVGKELQEESKDYQKQVKGPVMQGNANGVQNGGGRPLKKYHAATGDTADLWTQPRQWLMTPAMNGNYVSFDYKPDKEMRSGDRYRLSMKLFTGGGNAQLVLALEYLDGSISFITRNMSHNGWLEMVMQADTARTVRRIYGHMSFKMTNTAPIAFADSIELVRTHFDAQQYGFISVQKNLYRNLDGTSAPASPSITAKPVTRTPEPRAQVVASPNAQATMQREGHYKPKPGVNKSGVEHQRRQLTPIRSLRNNPKPSNIQR